MGFVEVSRETEWRRPLLVGGVAATPHEAGA
jgi:hypothetical protein